VRCHDCGVNLGGLVSVNGRIQRLCESCGETREQDGDNLVDVSELDERRADYRADEALADR
jgi:hypothetical protein